MFYDTNLQNPICLYESRLSRNPSRAYKIQTQSESILHQEGLIWDFFLVFKTKFPSNIFQPKCAFSGTKESQMCSIFLLVPNWPTLYPNLTYLTELSYPERDLGLDFPISPYLINYLKPGLMPRDSNDANNSQL